MTSLKQIDNQSFLKEFFKGKLIFNFLFFWLVFLDALGAVFPEFLDRRITIFIPLPLILLIYFLNAEKKSILFILAIVINFLGQYKFNNAYQVFDSLGLVMLGLGFFIYFIILFKEYGILNIKTVMKYGAIIFTFIGVPLIFYIDGIEKKMVYNEIIIYIFMMVLFVFSTLVLYLKKRTKLNNLLLFATISVQINCYSDGYNLFVESSNLLVFFSAASFNLTHYFMCWYMIKSYKNEVSVIS
jgi:hypothetical protein